MNALRPTLLAIACAPILSAQSITLPSGDPDPAYPNLYAWYDASNGVNSSPTPLPDGTPVTNWDDLSATGRHLTRVDSNSSERPTVVDDMASCGQAVRFDGDDYIWASRTDGTWGGYLTTDRTFFVVCEVDTADGGYVFDSSTSGGRTALFAGQTSAPGQWQIYFSPSGGTVGSVAVEEHRYQVHSIVLAAGLQEHYIDLDVTPVATGTIATIGQLGGLVLGSRYSVTNFLTGHIKEVLIYDAALGAGDRLTIAAYLSNRHSGAYVENYGMGCVGTNGLVPELRAIGCPSIGSTFALKLRNALPNANCSIEFGSGRTAVAIGGCELYFTASICSAPGVTDANGEFVLGPLPIPASSSAFTILCQGFTIDPAAAPLGVSFSDGAQINVF